MDSNHRSLWRQIYSLLPLATREPAHMKLELVTGIEPATCWLQISCSANWATPARLIGDEHQNKEKNGDAEGARTLDLQRDRLAF